MTSDVNQLYIIKPNCTKIKINLCVVSSEHLQETEQFYQHHRSFYRPGELWQVVLFAPARGEGCESRRKRSEGELKLETSTFVQAAVNLRVETQFREENICKLAGTSCEVLRETSMTTHNPALKLNLKYALD